MTNDAATKKKSTTKNDRKNLDLSPFAENYWNQLANGTKNSTFTALIDLGIPLHQAGITNRETITSLIDTGVINLFESLQNATSAEAESAIKWAIAKAVLGEEVELIKAGSIQVVTNQKESPKISEEKSATNTEKDKRPKMMPKQDIPAFLN